ncbi:MAG: Ldh family oxidoreductase [Xanthobacteraceae bacterium]
MSQETSDRIPAERIERFVAGAFVAAGLPADDALTLARLMVEADLRGSDTHGVIRLPLYTRRIRAGGINPKPNIRVVSDRPSAALIDGDNGMGHLVMKRAAELAIEKAKATGMGWVGARMSNHAGPASLYVTMPLPHDMIGLYFAVGSNNHLPPWGGSESLLGTNPMAVAVPAANEPPIVLDMAPTVAAYGKVRLKAQRGEQMPVGWMIDREGKPLTDPKRADEGNLLPIGDYKGYGLSLIIGLLAGAQSRRARPRRHRFRQEYRPGDQYRASDRSFGGRDLHAGRRVQTCGGSSDPRHPQFAKAAGRRAHLAAGRAEPHQASRPPRAWRADAQSAARQP